MTIHPCPRCGKVPTVTVCGTPFGNLWVADCGCFAVHSTDTFGLGYSWAVYCVEMGKEADADD